MRARNQRHTWPPREPTSLGVSSFGWGLGMTRCCLNPRAALAHEGERDVAKSQSCPVGYKPDLRARRRQGSRDSQQGSDEREGAVFRDTASLVTTTGSSRLPANPALECFKMRWTLELFGAGENAPFGGMLAAIDAFQPQARTTVPRRRVQRPAITYRPCLMPAAILQANGRSAIKHILNIDHLPSHGILIATHGKV